MAAGRPPRDFLAEHGGKIPVGIRRTVVPAAPDAWIMALERYGTMSFGDVAAAAIRFASEGFPMHAVMADNIAKTADDVPAVAGERGGLLPNGRPPREGELFVQADLARTIQYMADQEARRPTGSRGRPRGGARRLLPR